LLSKEASENFYFSSRKGKTKKVEEEESEADEDHIYKFDFPKIDCFIPRRDFVFNKKFENIDLMIGEFYNCQSKFRILTFYNI